MTPSKNNRKTQVNKLVNKFKETVEGGKKGGKVSEMIVSHSFGTSTPDVKSLGASPATAILLSIIFDSCKVTMVAIGATIFRDQGSPPCRPQNDQATPYKSPVPLKYSRLGVTVGVFRITLSAVERDFVAVARGSLLCAVEIDVGAVRAVLAPVLEALPGHDGDRVGGPVAELKNLLGVLHHTVGAKAKVVLLVAERRRADVEKVPKDCRVAAQQSVVFRRTNTIVPCKMHTVCDGGPLRRGSGRFYLCRDAGALRRGGLPGQRQQEGAHAEDRRNRESTVRFARGTHLAGRFAVARG